MSRLLELVDQPIEAFGVDMQVEHRGPELAEDAVASRSRPPRGRQLPQETPHETALLTELRELTLDEGDVVRLPSGVRAAYGF